jgi:hypothetical protein
MTNWARPSTYLSLTTLEVGKFPNLLLLCVPHILEGHDSLH